MFHLCHIPAASAWQLKEGKSFRGAYSTGVSTVTLVLEAETPTSPQGNPQEVCEPADLTSRHRFGDVD